MFHLFPSIEELVLEESPKWKLLADVLDEIERDDAKNDTKRKFAFLVGSNVHQLKHFSYVSITITSSCQLGLGNHLSLLVNLVKDT